MPKMSAPQNAVCRQVFAVPECLNRSLLLCRFDFRQKSWGLTPLEVYLDRDRDSIFPFDSTALASAIFKNISDFSDPSLGGANPQNPQSVGLESARHSAGPLGKNKKTNHKK
jgi:hypothetical protein